MPRQVRLVGVRIPELPEQTRAALEQALGGPFEYVGEIMPRSGPEATEMITETGAEFALLRGEGPLPNHGLDQGIRFLIVQDDGSIEELVRIEVITKPFAP